MVSVFGKRFRLFHPRSIWIRKLVQWFFFLLIALIAIYHTLAESGGGIPILSSASLHAVCPFGGVETLYTFATAGLLVKRIHDSSLVLAAIVLLMAILFGPVFCGWVCPLGTVQEVVGKLGKNCSSAAITTSSRSGLIMSVIPRITAETKTTAPCGCFLSENFVVATSVALALSRNFCPPPG